MPKMILLYKSPITQTLSSVLLVNPPIRLATHLLRHLPFYPIAYVNTLTSTHPNHLSIL